MAKNTIRTYSTTAASNTDVGGVDIQGTAPASNMDDSVREVMSHLAETNAGTAPLDDTFSLCDPADATKKVRLDAGAVTAGQTRVLAMPDANVTIPSGTLVTEAGTQTLTNKTLTSPTINSPTIATPAITDSITVTSADAGATAGPSINLYRNSASPLASDVIGAIFFSGEDSAGNTEFYAYEQGVIVDPTSGSEDANIIWITTIGGAQAGRMSIGAGLFMAGATGGDPGAGKINATAYNVNGAQIPFSKSFESTQQTITAAGSLTLAHSLGTTPKLYQAYLQCTTAELGYSIADEVAINPNTQGTADQNRGVSLVPDGTNINVRFGQNANSFEIVRKDTGVLTTITNTSWRLVVRAWA
jgi:hypothetical protein